ncbi:MAG: hypothetical protein RLZZ141_2325 [Pseudomonadota bacterium]
MGLGCHSLRVGPASLRDGLVQRFGAGGFKGLYSIVSVIGFALIIWGYGLARATPTLVWLPPVATRHIAILLMLPALILMVATYVPGNVLKAKLHHPMVLSVKVWALAHLLSNGNLADILLFGSFLIWAVLAFRAAPSAPPASATVPIPPRRCRPSRLASS